MKRVLAVGLTYSSDPIEGVEIDNLGLCQPKVAHDRAVFPLYEYDTIIINPYAMLSTSCVSTAIVTLFRQ